MVEIKLTNMIPTAKELVEQHQLTWKSTGAPVPLISTKNLEKSLVEFARLHVEAALKAASEKSMLAIQPEGLDKQFSKESQYSERGGHGEPNWTTRITINEESILNAYPLENIK